MVQYSIKYLCGHCASVRKLMRCFYKPLRNSGTLITLCALRKRGAFARTMPNKYLSGMKCCGTRKDSRLAEMYARPNRMKKATL